ncbi:MAG: hypothetical protein ACI4PQ_02740, partial [Butyricicoccaceae bacterium]
VQHFRERNLAEYVGTNRKFHKITPFGDFILYLCDWATELGNSVAIYKRKKIKNSMDRAFSYGCCAVFSVFFCGAATARERAAAPSTKERR